MGTTSWQPMNCSRDFAELRLRELWEVSTGGVMCIKPEFRARDRRYGVRDLDAVHPIAGGPYDQYDALDNPMWDLVRWFPTVNDGCHCTKLPKVHLPYADIDAKILTAFNVAGIDRYGLCTAFAFSICTPGDLTWIKQLIGARGIVEIGAGRGYWAYMLEQAGVTVHPYDMHVPGDTSYFFNTSGTFTDVHRGDHNAVRDHDSDVLFMSWPSYDEPWAYEALRAYRGDMVIYAGEGDGGCTADDAFHDLLESDWTWLSTSSKHMTWWGIHDTLTAYVRS